MPAHTVEIVMLCYVMLCYSRICNQVQIGRKVVIIIMISKRLLINLPLISDQFHLFLEVFRGLLQIATIKLNHWSFTAWQPKTV